MPTLNLLPTADATLRDSDDTRYSGLAAGATFTSALDAAPDDYGTLNGATITVEAMATGSGRDKNILVELLDSGGVILGSFTTGIIPDTDTVYTSPDLGLGPATKADVDGWQIRVTCQDGGGGMPGNRTTSIDQAFVTLDYAAAVTAVNSVTVTPASATVEVGGTTQLTATVDATGGASEAVTWTSDNETVATVDATGLVTGVAEGAATITATSDHDGTKSDTSTITVEVPPPSWAGDHGFVTAGLEAFYALENELAQVDAHGDGPPALFDYHKNGNDAALGAAAALYINNADGGHVHVPHIEGTDFLTTPHTASLAITGNMELITRVTPVDAAAGLVAWGSNGPGAKVLIEGRLLPVGAGEYWARVIVFSPDQASGEVWNDFDSYRVNIRE